MIINLSTYNTNFNNVRKNSKIESACIEMNRPRAHARARARASLSTAVKRRLISAQIKIKFRDCRKQCDLNSARDRRKENLITRRALLINTSHIHN